MLELLSQFFSGYLIECMASLLACSLLFRWAAYKAAKYDDIFFSTFTREVEKTLQDDEKKKVIVEDPDQYLQSVLDRVVDKLPVRSLRFGRGKKESSSRFASVRATSMRDYAGGQRSLFHSILNESATFKNKFPPNYIELTRRILHHDKNWVKLFGVVPIDGISRMIDILPGLFIVIGVFGTFLGISQALPEIARIDFDNLDQSSSILQNFVTSVTFAMNTSIAGILFSISITILNTLFPLKKVRQAVFRKVSNTFEVIWLSMQRKANLDDEMIKVLPKMLSCLQSIERKIKVAPSGTGGSENIRRIG